MLSRVRFMGVFVIEMRKSVADGTTLDNSECRVK